MPFEGIHGGCFQFEHAHDFRIKAKSRPVVPEILLQSHFAWQNENFLPPHILLQPWPFHAHDKAFQNPLLRVPHPSDTLPFRSLEHVQSCLLLLLGELFNSAKKSLITQLGVFFFHGSYLACQGTQA